MGRRIWGHGVVMRCGALTSSFSSKLGEPEKLPLVKAPLASPAISFSLSDTRSLVRLACLPGDAECNDDLPMLEWSRGNERELQGGSTTGRTVTIST